jgi:hemerythrin superfamily protein
MNGIEMIKKDHREIEAMFKKLERNGAANALERPRIVQSIVRELSKHTSVEEEILYPLIRRRIAKLEPAILKSLEEHHVVKVTLAELEHRKPSDERFFAKVLVLIDEVRKHIEEEEDLVLPAVERTLSERELETLGRAIDRAKKAAPTRPHPLAPDTPPGNVIAGIGAALLVRARDAGRGMVSRGTTRRGDGQRGREAAAAKRGRPQGTTRAVSRTTHRSASR